MPEDLDLPADLTLISEPTTETAPKLDISATEPVAEPAAKTEPIAVPPEPTPPVTTGRPRRIARKPI